MSADNFYVLCKHAKGGYALVMGQGDPGVTPRIRVRSWDTQTSFASLTEALRAYSDGQELGDDEIYPRYYSEYGLVIDAGVFKDLEPVVTGYVYYRCQKCGKMTPPKQLEPADDLGPHDYDCDCWKGPVWQRGVWRPEENVTAIRDIRDPDLVEAWDRLQGVEKRYEIHNRLKETEG